MLLKNTSTATVTTQNGLISIAPGASADVPWTYVRDDPILLEDLISGALVPLTLEGFDWSNTARPFQGTWLSTTTLAGGSGTFTLPNTLFTGPFRACRLYFITVAGTATFSLEASADGGVNWCPLPDFGNVALSGNSAVAVPAGTVLLQGSLTPGSGGWTGSIEFTMIA